jgi:large subunit ribosomal protein L24
MARTASQTLRIRKGDTVQVITGKDRGKRGKVLEALPRERKLIVENLNMAKDHRRPKALRDRSRMGAPQIIPGGIYDLAAPMPVSNVMIVCPVCDRATRIGYEYREAKDGTIKVRVCKRADCHEVVDR